MPGNVFSGFTERKVHHDAGILRQLGKVERIQIFRRLGLVDVVKRRFNVCVRLEIGVGNIGVNALRGNVGKVY